MSSRKLLLFIIFIGGYNSFAMAQQFSLNEAIKYGLQNSKQITTADIDIKIAESQIDQIIATGIPQISGNVDLSYNFKVPTSFIPAILFDPNAEEGQFLPVQFGTEYNGQAALVLNQMVFRGEYFVGLKTAKTFREVASLSKGVTEVDIIEAVTKAYYGALIAEEQIQFLNENYGRLDSLYNETNIMYQNGFVEKIDVTRIKIQLNNIKAEIDNSEQTVKLAYNILKFQMGYPINDTISLTESMNTIKIPDFSVESGNTDFSEHLQIRQLNASEQFATWDKKYIQSQYIPSIDLYGTLGANVGTNSFNNYFNFNDNWFGLGSVGVRMKVPVFDGMYKSKVIQEKQMQIEKIQVSRELLKNSLELQNNNLRIQLNKNIDKVANQKENVDLATEIYTTAKIKYNEGLGSNLELINADTSLKEAQTNYYNALYELLIANIELEKTLGTIDKNEY